MANEIELPILFPLKGDGPKQAQEALKRVGETAEDTKKKVSGVTKEIDSFGKTVAQGFGLGAGFAVGTKAAEALISAVKSIPDEIGRVVSKASELSNLAGTIDASTESLQRMGFMGSLTGTSMESLASVSLLVQRRIEEMPGAFDKWGLSARRMKDMKPEEQLVAISEAIRAIPEPSRQVAAAYDLMGRAGASNLNLLRKDLGSLLAESDQLGVAMGDDLVGQLDDVDSATTKLSAAWEGLRDRLIGGAVAASGADEFLGNLAIAMGAVNAGAKDNEGLRIWVALIERLAGTGQLKQAAALLALGNERGPGPSRASGTKGAIDTTFASPDQINFERILQDALKQTKVDVDAVTKAERERARQQEELNKLWAASVAQFLPRHDAHVKEYQLQLMMAAGMRLVREEASKSLRDQMKERDERTGSALSDQIEKEIKIAAEREVIVGRTVTGIDRAVDAVQALQTAWQFVTIAVDAYANAVAGARNGTEGAAQGALSGMQQGAAFGPYGAAAGFVIGGVAGWLGGKEAEQQILRQNALSRINEHMESASNILARLDEIRRRTAEVVASGAQGLSAMFEGATSPEHFERLGRLALAGVTAMKAQGYSILEIFRALGPALEAARSRLQEFGQGPQSGKDKMTGEDTQFLTPFEDLLHFQELVAANEDLIRSIEGTGAVIAMLRETGSLTGQNLGDVLTTVAQDYDRLIGQGFTHSQALAVQADSLRELDRLQREGLITVDALTQARIDEAKAAGLLDPSPQEQIKELMDLQLLVLVAQAQMMGVTLPAAVQEYINSLSRIPTNVNTNVTLNGQAVSGGPGPVTPSSTPNSNTLGGNVPGHAGGFYSPSLPSDYYFMAHRGERVEITPAAQTAARNASSGANYVYVTVEGDGDAEKIKRTVLDAMRNDGAFRSRVSRRVTA